MKMTYTQKLELENAMLCGVLERIVDYKKIVYPNVHSADFYLNAVIDIAEGALNKIERNRDWK